MKYDTDDETFFCEKKCRRLNKQRDADKRELRRERYTKKYNRAKQAAWGGDHDINQTIIENN